MSGKLCTCQHRPMYQNIANSDKLSVRPLALAAYLAPSSQSMLLQGYFQFVAARPVSLWLSSHASACP